ncbi:unnamed protein product [Orchesella dallaii]|uniref:Uncharacterized protein n=1 Tax=Orchesella dallaii TaxID=48710 RepID=A0ABP1PSL4_9HEXA
MKTMLVASVIMGSLLSLAYATDVASVQGVQSQVVNSIPVVTGTELQGPEPRDGHGGGDGGHGQHHYHYSHGQELFSGDEWLLAIPLLLIPVIALACWYFWGGSKDDGYGWDRMGYSESSYTPGAYESRMLRGADALPKSTHQRIFNAIQQ